MVVTIWNKPVSTCCFAVTWLIVQPFHGFAGQTVQDLSDCKCPVCCRDNQVNSQDYAPADRKRQASSLSTACANNILAYYLINTKVVV